MTAPARVDVLVVGAGPAGSSAARAAASAGASVLLVDGRQTIGVPVRCGEYVSRMLLVELEGVAGCVAQQTKKLVFHLPSGTAELAAPGAVLDRDLFDQTLAEYAAQAGASLRTSHRFVGLSGHRAGIRTPSGTMLVTAGTIIGADGPCSPVARAAGLGLPERMLALQHRVRLRRQVDDAHLYFWPTPRFGYGWLFPKQDLANVGVAVPWRRPDLARQAMAELCFDLDQTGTIAPAPLSRVFGLVPSGGPSPSIARGRLLLAGDAAGQVDALTGAGIASAVRCGRLAGEAACIGTATPAEAYEKAFSRLVGSYLERSLVRRDVMREAWDADLDRAIRASWLDHRPSP